MKKPIELIVCMVVWMIWSVPAFGSDSVLMMATTTSTDNTGLLDYLEPHFRNQTGVELRWTATGTGKALKLGQNCDVDILMVHAPAAEKQFVASGFGVDRRQIMYNDFILIGPANDPAGIRGMDVVRAFRRIQEKGVRFISRGDNSGTHKKEMGIWKQTGMALPEKQPWYIQTGQGMLASIKIANERNGYILTDRGTFIRYEANIGGNSPLKIVVEGGELLKNQYSVITVNPGHCKDVKHQLAKQFTDWICGPEAQRLIADFKLLGKQLFTPNAK